MSFDPAANRLTKDGEPVQSLTDRLSILKGPQGLQSKRLKMAQMVEALKNSEDRNDKALYAALKHWVNDEPKSETKVTENASKEGIKTADGSAEKVSEKKTNSETKSEKTEKAAVEKTAGNQPPPERKISPVRTITSTEKRSTASEKSSPTQSGHGALTKGPGDNDPEAFLKKIESTLKGKGSESSSQIDRNYVSVDQCVQKTSVPITEPGNPTVWKETTPPQIFHAVGLFRGNDSALEFVLHIPVPRADLSKLTTEQIDVLRRRMNDPKRITGAKLVKHDANDNTYEFSCSSDVMKTNCTRTVQVVMTPTPGNTEPTKKYVLTETKEIYSDEKTKTPIMKVKTSCM
jgi:hypothetical protein